MDLSFLYSLGYVGAFLAGVFSSATLFLPTPGFLVIIAMAASHYFNPVMLGVFAGFGAALGETVSYLTAYGGEVVFSKKYDIEKRTEKVREYFSKYGADVIIFFFAVSPLPFDIIGLFCGAVEYPFHRFLAATALGKIVKYILIALAAYYGADYFIGWYHGLS